MCSSLTSYIMSKNWPHSFSSICLSLGNSECKYASDTAKVPMSHPSYVSITTVENRSPKEAIGDEIFYPYFTYFFKLPLAHDLPFTPPYHFTLNKFTASIDYYYYYLVKRYVFMGTTTGFHDNDPLSICLDDFIIVAIATYQTF